MARMVRDKNNQTDAHRSSHPNYVCVWGNQSAPAMPGRPTLPCISRRMVRVTEGPSVGRGDFKSMEAIMSQVTGQSAGQTRQGGQYSAVWTGASETCDNTRHWSKCRDEHDSSARLYALTHRARKGSWWTDHRSTQLSA